MFAPVELYDLFCFQRMSESLQDVLYHVEVETHFILYVFDIYPFFLIYLFSFFTWFTRLMVLFSHFPSHFRLCGACSGPLHLMWMCFFNRIPPNDSVIIWFYFRFWILSASISSRMNGYWKSHYIIQTFYCLGECGGGGNADGRGWGKTAYLFNAEIKIDDNKALNCSAWTVWRCCARVDENNSHLIWFREIMWVVGDGEEWTNDCIAVHD